MRYLARRYGEFFGFKIPSVLSIDQFPFDHQTLETRKDLIFQTGNIVFLNRINKLNAREFIRTVMEVRTRYPNKLIYLPAFGLPNDYPILFYAGIDLLDDSSIRLLGDNNCLSEFGVYRGSDCLTKNEEQKVRVLDLINLSLENGKFREIVETHSFSNFSKEALRILDMEFYQYIDGFMDYRPKKIVAANVEGIYRPEIVNYRERIKGLRQTAENLLLIPCSAIKPYSQSKTHRILHSFVHSSQGGIQEVIVTSPLGLVPRELESFFPPMYYDIPVTGYWFEEERKVLYDLSKEYFLRKKYANVFYLLPQQEGDILGLFENTEGVTGSINFENSEKLSKIIDSHKIQGDKRKKESIEIANVLKFMFDIDLEPEHLKQRKEGNRRIILLNDLPILRRTMSGIKMMKGLGDVLLSKGMRVVETEGIFKGDNLFIPGIKGVSEDVKPGMEVALVKDGSVIGRGMSQVSGLDLLMEKRGIGVNDVTYFNHED
jgi:archaeosine synthase